MTNTTPRFHIARCSECGEVAREVPPARPMPWDEPQFFSHLDGEPLCPTVLSPGYGPCAPAFEFVSHEGPEVCPVGVAYYLGSGERALVLSAVTSLRSGRQWATVQLGEVWEPELQFIVDFADLVPVVDDVEALNLLLGVL